MDDYALKVKEQLDKAGIRAEVDIRSDKISYKIREHSLKKVPVIFAVGAKEVQEKTVSVRRLGSETQEVLALDDALSKLQLSARD